MPAWPCTPHKSVVEHDVEKVMKSIQLFLAHGVLRTVADGLGKRRPFACPLVNA
jgi:hypothetical protein